LTVAYFKLSVFNEVFLHENCFAIPGTQSCHSVKVLDVTRAPAS